jgi:hypothetical protein
MTGTVDEYYCPACGSEDLTVVKSDAIASELLECRGCLRLYQIKSTPDGTKRLVPV